MPHPDVYGGAGDGLTEGDAHYYYAGAPMTPGRMGLHSLDPEVPDICKPRNSILHRPVRSPSQKNQESSDLQAKRDNDRLLRASAKYQNWELNKGSAFTAGMSIDDLTDFERLRGIKANRDMFAPAYNFQALEPSHPAHAVNRIHFTSDYDAHIGCGDPITWTKSPPPIKSRPWHGDDAEKTGKMASVYSMEQGTYNPITHHWVIEPADPRAMDREQPAGRQRGTVWSADRPYRRRVTDDLNQGVQCSPSPVKRERRPGQAAHEMSYTPTYSGFATPHK